jgi:hypothetical protein
MPEHDRSDPETRPVGEEALSDSEKCVRVLTDELKVIEGAIEDAQARGRFPEDMSIHTFIEDVQVHLTMLGQGDEVEALGDYHYSGLPDYPQTTIRAANALKDYLKARIVHHQGS